MLFFSHNFLFLWECSMKQGDMVQATFKLTASLKELTLKPWRSFWLDLYLGDLQLYQAFLLLILKAFEPDFRLGNYVVYI